MLEKENWKARLAKSLKIAGAAALSIAIAGELGLKYSPTAGIITVLSIQNTKRETFRSAANRGLAFLCALGIARACFGLLGYNLWGFALYLLAFALLCLWAGWGEAISMDSVLVTHFLTEGHMEGSMLLNELALLVLGTGMGILVNLHLRRSARAFDSLAKEADAGIRRILRWIAGELKREIKPEGQFRDSTGELLFEETEKALEEAMDCAARNYGNSVLQRDTAEIDYIRMRERQSLVLREMAESLGNLSYLPPQAGQVADLLARIESDYSRENTVAGLLEQLESLLGQMKMQDLPESREEFEARAILYYILMQTGRFLELKREFRKRVSAM